MEARLNVVVSAVSIWPERLRAVARDGITLWQADLDEVAATSRAGSAAPIEAGDDRTRRLTGSRLLRRVIAWTGAPRVAANANPRAAAQPGLHYSVSRCGARWLLALGPCALGVDIERIEAERALSLARRVLTARELRVWQRRQALGRERSFFAAWTAKEAVAKAVGRDHALPPSAIELPPAALHWRRLPSPADARAWWLRQLRADDGYAAALCAEQPLRMVARVHMRGGGDFDLAA